MTGRGSVDCWAVLALALALLLLPLQWVFAAMLAAIIHELCHYLTIVLCGGEVRGISVGLTGVRMEVRGLTPVKELLCALAGPIGGFLLLFAARWLPRTAVCAAFHSLFNLLPVYPLDGGRALRCSVDLLLPMTLADKICNAMEWMCLGSVSVLGLYGTFILHLGLLPILLAVTLTIRVLRGKIPCKPGIYSVQ